jgi:energy-coupling factor transporter ATP-binding protein EcfA2
MKLEMIINNIKSIRSLHISLPLEKGLYAITGQNASGKSTVITCASSAYFNMRMNDYFGKTPDDASISFELNGAKKEWRKVEGNTGKYWQVFFKGNFQLKGFYEGSIIFGNRFRNTKYDLLMKLDRIDDSKLQLTSDFIRINLGKILHNNEAYYDKILRLNNKDAGNIVRFDGDIFYYQKGLKRVSQFHMSTGENLLISILNSIDKRNTDRNSVEIPCLLLLDEIELALHPSSLKRLLNFLRNISNRYNYAVYFSTHAIELISSIDQNNIFFLERHADDSIEILNPCFPAYAKRILYDHEGYDYIIMVEDDLARAIIRKLLKDNLLLNNKLVHVLPCGGFTNTIDLANEVISSNLVGKISKISIILDKDVKKQAEDYMITHGIINNIPLNYLPIESFEKHLKNKLIDNVDHDFYRKLNDMVFHQKSLNQLIEEYHSKYDMLKDRNGKKFYSILDDELRNRNRTRDEIIEIVIDNLLEKERNNLESLTNFLRKTLS